MGFHFVIILVSRCGVDINCAADDGTCALLAASANGPFDDCGHETRSDLPSGGMHDADFHYSTTSPDTIHTGHVEVLGYLLKFVDGKNCVDSQGRDAVQHAALGGHGQRPTEV